MANIYIEFLKLGNGNSNEEQDLNACITSFFAQYDKFSSVIQNPCPNLVFIGPMQSG